MTKEYVDPEYERWYRKYPKYPGLVKCVELLNRSNVKGAWIDIISHELEKHAHEEADDLHLIASAEIETDSWVGRILLQVIVKSKLPDAFSLYAELLQSPDDSLRRYGMDGLQQLNTKEARRLLWEQSNS